MNILPDPGVQFGHFRVLPYAPGGYAVIDDRRPPGNQKIARMSSLDDASQYAAIRDAADGEREERKVRTCACKEIKFNGRVVGKNKSPDCEIHR